MSQGPGKLVDMLIAASYGGVKLYTALQQLVEDKNPSIALVVTPSFPATLHACPAASQVMSAHLSDYAGGGLIIAANCTVAPFGNLQRIFVIWPHHVHVAICRACGQNRPAKINNGDITAKWIPAERSESTPGYSAYSSTGQWRPRR